MCCSLPNSLTFIKRIIDRVTGERTIHSGYIFFNAFKVIAIVSLICEYEIKVHPIKRRLNNIVSSKNLFLSKLFENKRSSLGHGFSCWVLFCKQKTKPCVNKENYRFTTHHQNIILLGQEQTTIVIHNEPECVTLMTHASLNSFDFFLFFCCTVYRLPWCIQSFSQKS